MKNVATAVVCFWLAAAASAQQPGLTVQDGQVVTLEGMMHTRRIANSFYTVLLPSSPVTGAVPDDVSLRPQRTLLKQIDVRMDGQYRELRRLNGMRVTVIGKLSIDRAILMNDAMIEATEIRMGNGMHLFPLPARTPQPVPANIARYAATATFWAKSGHFNYSSLPELDAATNFLSCDFTRSGEILNCFCASGFSAQNNFPSSGDQALDKPPHFSQFVVPEYIAQNMQWRVLCKRMQ